MSQLKPIKYENKLISVYDVAEVKDYRIHQMIQSILSEAIEDTLPVYLRDQLNLVSRHQAYQWIHFPKNEKDIDEALNYFKVEEAWHLFKGIMPVKKRQHMKLTQFNDFDQYLYKLPFELTEDQKNSTSYCFGCTKNISIETFNSRRCWFRKNRCCIFYCFIFYQSRISSCNYGAH